MGVQTMKKWLDIISVGFKFLSEFMNFWELGKLKRLGVLGYNLKQKIDIVTDKDENIDRRIDFAFDALDLVLEYKRQNPQEFDEIFSALEAFSKKRKSDKSIDLEIKSILDSQNVKN